MTRWEITVDKDVCVGSGSCLSVAPDVFHLDDEDRSCARAGAVAPDERLLDAAELCPTGAIRVVDTGTGRSRLD
jgi:ferredoxin